MKPVLMFYLFFPVALISHGQSLTDGEYMIKIFETGQFLAIAGGAANNGAGLIQWDKEYGRHFFFLLTHLGDDEYTIQAKHSGKFISIDGPVVAGARMTQWDWKDQHNQKWHIYKQAGSRGYVISAWCSTSKRMKWVQNLQNRH